MSHNLALIIALAAPVLVIAALRINAALVFLSLCLGAVLVEYVAGEANSLLTLFSEDAGTISASSLQLALLFGPAAATCVLTIFSVHGRLRVPFNVLPAAAATALAVLLAIPLLPLGLRFALEDQAVWQELVRAQALIIGAGAVVSLFFLWTQRRSLRHHDKRRH